MATLGLKEMGKLLWEGRGKSLPCWLSQFSFAKLRQGRPFSLPSQRNFPISFKPKVAIAEFFWKMQGKTWYSILGLDAMPLFLKNLLLIVTTLFPSGISKRCQISSTTFWSSTCPFKYFEQIGATWRGTSYPNSRWKGRITQSLIIVWTMPVTFKRRSNRRIRQKDQIVAVSTSNWYQEPRRSYYTMQQSKIFTKKINGIEIFEWTRIGFNICFERVCKCINIFFWQFLVPKKIIWKNHLSLDT